MQEIHVGHGKLLMTDLLHVFNSNKISINQVDFRGKSIHGPAEIADDFNEHFSTVAEDISTNLQTPTVNFEDFLSKIDIKITFYLQEINQNDIFKLINKRNTSKATGIDNIPTKLLRICADFISLPIAWIFNKSISSRIFPKELQYSKIIPLFKKGKHSDQLNNYRPISIIPVVAKLFERIV